MPRSSDRRRKRSRRRGPFPAGRDGFTLIEVIVAITLLTAVLLPTSAFMVSEMQESGNIRSRVVAANLVDQAIGQAESESFSTLVQAAPPGGSAQTTTQTVGSITYTISTQTSWQPESATAGGCDNPGNGAAGLESELLVVATATWTGMLGTPPVRADTTLTPDPSTVSPQDGNLAVTVLGPGPQNTPQANLPITVTGPGGGVTSDSTDTNGCLFLAYESPGSYSFYLSKPGYVTNQEAATIAPPQPQATVNLQTGTIPVTFDYSQGASILAQFTGAGPAPIGLPVTVAESELTPAGTFTFAGGTTSVTSMSLTPLWPYNDGYQVFAGQCPEANPAAIDSNNNALYSSSVAAPTTAVTAGQTSVVNVPLYPLTVTLSHGSKNTAVTGDIITITEQAGTAGTKCGTPRTYQLSGVTTGTATSATIQAGIPLGHFTVGVLDRTGSPVLCGPGTPCTASIDMTGSAVAAAVALP